MGQKLLKSRGKVPLCKCGCGQPVKWSKQNKCWNKFIDGHQSRGKLFPNAKCRPPVREKPPLCACGCAKPVNWQICKGRWGVYISHHHRRGIIYKSNIRDHGKAPFCKCGCGQPVKNWSEKRGQWATYLLGHQNRGRKRSTETRRKISEALTGEKHPMFGKKHTKETRRKMSETLAGGKYVGSNSHNWKGGVTYNCSPPELNPKLIQSIRRRDNFKCCFCGLRIKGKHRRFDTHHIDDDRANNHPDNIITLCKECHSDTRKTGDKEAWQRVCANLVKKAKYQNPKLHCAAVRIYRENMRRFYK